MREARTTRRRYLLTVGTVGAVAIAGCSSGGDGNGDGDGATPDDGTTAGTGTDAPGTAGGTTAEATTRSAALDPPAGTGEGGIEDRAALIGATETALTETDHDLRQRQASSGSGGIDVTQRKRSSLDDERQLFVFDASTETNRVYTEGGTRYSKTTSDGETSYDSGEARQEFAELHAPELLDGRESLGGFFQFGSYALGETVTRNGRRLVRFDLESASLGNDSYDVTESEGELFVSEDSVVFGAALSLTAESDEETFTLEKGFAIERLGDVTVERPEWFDRAASTTTPDE